MAIKFLQLGSRFHERFVAREIINHRLLSHPHIVAFKEVFVTPQVGGPGGVGVPSCGDRPSSGVARLAVHWG